MGFGPATLSGCPASPLYVPRNELCRLGEDALADGIDRYLEKRNRDNEPEYVSRNVIIPFSY